MPTLREELEIMDVIIAAIEKHARGDVEALARGIIEELRAAGLEIHPAHRRDPDTQSGMLKAGACVSRIAQSR